ncbi:hypothetical protein [Methylocystis parvus]|uniref:hypothetical protein n=1 Tax=Methylocystis parvus TaxID=134 RepID=UPI003C78F6C8
MAALSRARPTPVRSQYLSRARGQARDLSDLALVALGPAIAQLREAQNGMHATMLLADMIPPHMHAPLARYAVQHSAMFDGEIIAAVISYVGWEALARLIGEMATEAAFTRFVLPVQNAIVP